MSSAERIGGILKTAECFSGLTGESADVRLSGSMPDASKPGAYVSKHAHPASLLDPKSYRFCPALAQLVRHPYTQQHTPADGAFLFYVARPVSPGVGPGSESGSAGRVAVRGITRALKDIFAPSYSYKVPAPYVDPAAKQCMEHLRADAIRHDDAYTSLKDRYRIVIEQTEQYLQPGGLYDADPRQYDVTFGVPGLEVKRSAKPKKQKARKPKAPSSYASMIGVTRGTEVHTQMECYIDEGIDAFFKKYSAPHPMVDQIIKQLWIHGLTPLYSEFPVFHDVLFVGTNIDIVCKNRKNEMVLVELKTGCLDTMCKYWAPMGRPFVDVTDNRLWQAVLQIKFAALLLERKYGMPPVKTYVIVAENDVSITLDVDERIGWFRGKERENAFLQLFCDGVIKNNYVGAQSILHPRNSKALAAAAESGSSSGNDQPRTQKKRRSGESVASSAHAGALGDCVAGRFGATTRPQGAGHRPLTGVLDTALSTIKEDDSEKESGGSTWSESRSSSISQQSESGSTDSMSDADGLNTRIFTSLVSASSLPKEGLAWLQKKMVHVP